MLARLYDALHEDHRAASTCSPMPTEWGGFTHRYFRAPTTVEEQVAGRDAIAAWARITYGWLGRSPDYKAAFLGDARRERGVLRAVPGERAALVPYSQERVPFINHAIIHPPVDRNMAPGAPGGPTDVYARVTKETDAGIYVSGAKVVATGSALTHFTFVAHHGLIPVQGKNFAIVFMVPTNAKGVKLICRVSNEMRAAVLGSPFDYPLSSRLDENDAIFVMDNVFVPWEDVFVYADVEKANNFFPRTGFLPRALIHGCTRLAVKLDFITGLLIKATEITGARAFRGVEANIGEVIAWRNMIWGLSDAMAKTADPWTGGCILPGMEPAAAYQVLAPEAYVQIKNLIEKTVASGLIYLNSHARDFKTAGPAQVPRPLPAGVGRRRRGRAGQADEAPVGRGRDRVRRPARAVRDQLLRQPRGDPPLRAVRRARLRPVRPLEAVRRDRAWRSTTSTAGRRRTWSTPPGSARSADARARSTTASSGAALGRFATGVIVLSAGPRRTPHAMTANAFMSGSLEPPLVVVSVGKKARMHARLADRAAVRRQHPRPGAGAGEPPLRRPDRRGLRGRPSGSSPASPCSPSAAVVIAARIKHRYRAAITRSTSARSRSWPSTTRRRPAPLLRVAATGCSSPTASPRAGIAEPYPSFF